MSIAASIIASTLNAGTPLLIAAAGIVIHEKSGVLNLGIEGIMLMGAVTGFTVTLSTGSFALGFLAGAGVGILLGLLFAFFTLGMHATNMPLALHCRFSARDSRPLSANRSRDRRSRSAVCRAFPGSKIFHSLVKLSFRSTSWCTAPGC